MEKKVKEKNKKNNTSLIIIGILVLIVIGFNLLFRIVINSDNGIPGADCTVVVGRITHRYFGKVNHHCSAVDCESTSKVVSGKLTKNEYNELKERQKDQWNWVCGMFY